jgi:hypothetical protein
MSTEVDPKRSQPFRRSASAADARMVRKIDAGIFAKLLPHSTKSLSPGRPLSSPPPFPSLQNEPHPAVTQIKKETLAMKAYRTESSYYFSSRQLLPAGSLVFFSNKIRHYVHPTDGILLDSHPRLKLLSDAESQALEEQWRDALASY